MLDISVAATKPCKPRSGRPTRRVSAATSEPERARPDQETQQAARTSCVAPTSVKGSSTACKAPQLMVSRRLGQNNAVDASQRLRVEAKWNNAGRSSCRELLIVGESVEAN